MSHLKVTLPFSVLKIPFSEIQSSQKFLGSLRSPISPLFPGEKKIPQVGLNQGSLFRNCRYRQYIVGTDNGATNSVTRKIICRLQ